MAPPNVGSATTCRPVSPSFLAGVGVCALWCCGSWLGGAPTVGCSSGPRGPIEIEVAPRGWRPDSTGSISDGGEPTPAAAPDPKRVLEIEVRVPPHLAPGQRDTARAVARHADGSETDVTSLASWSSARPAVLATGDGGPQGIVALQPGVTTVAAEWNGVRSRGAGILIATNDQLPTLKPGAGATGGGADAPGDDVRSTGEAATAIAQWNVVPYQAFEQDFFAGVVAFHQAGIDRVEFSLDRGPWVAVHDMSFNPRSRTWEYFARINHADFATARALELRAVAFPRIGEPRRLAPLPLFVVPQSSASAPRCFVSLTGSNSGDGTRERPLRTLAAAALWIERTSPQNTADRGVIYLEAGEHDLGAVSERAPRTTRTYLTIEPAPGVADGSVSLVSASAGGLSTRLLRLRNLVIRTAIPTDEKLEDYLWIDECELEGKGRWEQVSSVGFINAPKWTGTFVTDCTIARNSDGLVNVTLARNVHVKEIGRDAFKNVQTIVNCTVDDIDKGETDWHPDVMQYTGPMENAVVYGLRARNLGAQGLFAKFSRGVLADVAWVNIEIESRAYLAQVKVPCDHLLLWGITLVNQPLSFTLPQHPASRNFSVRDCVFHQLWGNLPPGALADCQVGPTPPKAPRPPRSESLPPVNSSGHWVGGE
ncbi:MAG: hypothetical protein AB7O52_06930 [Planctomycetota bacterium]